MFFGAVVRAEAITGSTSGQPRCEAIGQDYATAILDLYVPTGDNHLLGLWLVLCDGAARWRRSPLPSMHSDVLVGKGQIP